MADSRSLHKALDLGGIVRTSRFALGKRAEYAGCRRF